VACMQACTVTHQGLPRCTAPALACSALGGAGCIGAAYSVTKTVHDLLTKFGTALVHMDIKPGALHCLDHGCIGAAAGEAPKNLQALCTPPISNIACCVQKTSRQELMASSGC